MGLEEELEHKRARVVRALGARGIEAEVPLPSPSPRRLGARARVSVDVSQEGRLVVHRPGTHEPVAAPMDAMARPEIAAAASALEAALVSEPRIASRLERLELRSDGGRVVAVFSGTLSESARARLAELALPALGPRGAVCLGGKTLAGSPRLRLDLGLGEPELEVGPLSFFQVNLEVNRAVVSAVVRGVMAMEPTRVLDLFGGAGNLSLPLAARGVPVELVESFPSAIKDARSNARRLGLPLTIAQEDAYRLEAGSRFFDVAVLDPPRRGAGPAMAAVCATRPRGIVLVSCHPASLARDLEQAMAHGYRLETLTLHDMFPLTSHVESLALLSR